MAHTWRKRSINKVEGDSQLAPRQSQLTVVSAMVQQRTRQVLASASQPNKQSVCISRQCTVSLVTNYDVLLIIKSYFCKSHCQLSNKQLLSEGALLYTYTFICIWYVCVLHSNCLCAFWTGFTVIGHLHGRRGAIPRSSEHKFCLKFFFAILSRIFVVFFSIFFIKFQFIFSPAYNSRWDLRDLNGLMNVLLWICWQRWILVRWAIKLIYMRGVRSKVELMRAVDVGK